MARHKFAFLAAPLAVPLFFLVWLLPGDFPARWQLTMVIIAAIFAYGGTLLFGVPAYFFLKAQNLTAIWVAMVAGFGIGALTWLVFMVLFPLSLDEGWSGVALGFSSLHTAKDIAWPGGVLGMVVGILFWVIARPDRPTGGVNE